MIVSRILGCPECGQLREAHGELAEAWPLQCVSCDHQWTESPALDSLETLRQVRALLERDCDASRRSFYNAAGTLAAIARLVDGFPTVVPRCEVQAVLLVGRPGDEVAPCPFCGEPIAFNDRVQRIGHELPVCDRFHTETRKQPNYFAAVQMLKSITVSA
jgi:hypothetical protein